MMGSSVCPSRQKEQDASAASAAATVDDRQHFMCECHVTHNFFVRSCEQHMHFDGDEAAFSRSFVPEPGGPSLEEVLDELRRQREKRLRNPEDAEKRAAEIRAGYRPLHPAVFQLDRAEFLAPGFRDVVSTLGRCCEDEVRAGISELKAKGLLTKIGNGLWSFPVLTDSFCDKLEEELRHFLASGLPHAAPNTMNRFGVILAELGLCPGLLDPFVRDYVDVLAATLLPDHTLGLDSYRAFTVLYDVETDGDRELAMHYDNAEVTLNINIGGSWEGGQVAFYGLATDPETDTATPIDVTLPRGHGVLHAGMELHQARPITAGRRHNLIIWCRSSGVRNRRCPMCFEEPRLRKTNAFADEGFRQHASSRKRPQAAQTAQNAAAPTLAGGQDDVDMDLYS
eukprot:TRINITY_DN21947_c0_g2_i1.p1 TRINITY_DN21947_c0_g2~~TRINITY_DN21947_c0_g2_i1.p1  ORF type:complete len:397 (+),score=94.68 TRINITY_DN21947_c0_g2_i1:59-1249(+)